MVDREECTTFVSLSCKLAHSPQSSLSHSQEGRPRGYDPLLLLASPTGIEDGTAAWRPLQSRIMGAQGLVKLDTQHYPALASSRPNQWMKTSTLTCEGNPGWWMPEELGYALKGIKAPEGHLRAHQPREGQGCTIEAACDAQVGRKKHPICAGHCVP